jgi:hypothetical protein
VRRVGRGRDRDCDGSTALTCVDRIRQTRWNGRSTRRSRLNCESDLGPMSTDHDTRQEHRRGHIVTRDKTTPLHPPLTASVTASLKSLHPTVDDIDRAPRSAIRPKISSEGDVSPGHASTSQATLAPPDFDSEAEERSSENVCKTNQPLHFRLDLRLCSIVRAVPP